MAKRRFIKVTHTQTEWDQIKGKVPKGDITGYVVRELSKLSQKELQKPSSSAEKKISRTFEITDDTQWACLLHLASTSKIRPATLVSRLVFSPLFK